MCINFKRINKYIAQKVKYVFIERSDYQVFNQWHKGNRRRQKDKLVSEIGKKNLDIINAHLDIQDEMFSFLIGEISSESLQVILKKSEIILWSLAII